MPESPLIVCLVSPLPPPTGGIASWSLGILQWVRDRNDIKITHVDTAVRWRSTNDFSRWMRLLVGSLQALRDTIRVFNTIRKVRPEIIHLCSSGSLGIPKDILILLLTKLMGVRSILHYRKGDLPEIILKQGFQWKLLRQAMLLADVVLLLDQQSEESAKAMLPYIRIERIPNPIDPEMIQEVVSSTTRKRLVDEPAQILFAGWVVSTKGVRELVDACLTIGNVPFELNLVGSVLDNFRRDLENIAGQRDGGKWLKFHGMLGRTEAIAAIASADLFVLPSYAEGFPNVVTEAMTLGKPIIATRVGAIPEMLGADTSEQCGMLVSSHNVDELRAAIIYMLTNPAEAKTYGERAKEKALTHYAMKKVIERYVGIWRSLKNRK